MGLTGGLFGCARCSSNSGESHADGGTAAVVEQADERTLFDFSTLPQGCDVAHRGLLIDFGEPHDVRAEVRGPKNTTVKLEAVEHERATFARVTGTELRAGFLGPEETWVRGTPITVQARIRGGGSRGVTLVVNGKVAGRANFERGETRVVTFTSSDLELLPGKNELSLRFLRSTDVAAEVDWVRIGPADEDGPFAAPTRPQISGSFKIGDAPNPELLRGFLLRAPGHVRCLTDLPAGARVRARVGLLGEGQAEVRVVLSRDRQEPQVLGSVKVATESATPEGSKVQATGVVPIDFEIPERAQLAALRFELASADKGVRIALGEPRVVMAPRPAPRPGKSQLTVLVVFGGLSRQFFSAKDGGAKNQPVLAALTERGLMLPEHRSNSTLSGAALAAMLTGTVDHGMTAGCKISKTAVTLAEVLRDAGVRSAFFTANPWSTEHHGFDRGFTVFESVLPGDSQSPNRVFELAQNFVQQHQKERMLVVVHARGGHPPWEINREVLKELPPQNYPGGLDPRHAGDLLARARAVPPLVRFSEADRQRMWAMHEIALHDELEALKQFYHRTTTLLAREGRGAATWYVTGDVAIDDSAPVPFGDGETLTEPALYPGLMMIAPDLPPGTSSAPTEGSMLASSIVRSFGLTPPKHFNEELFAAATYDRAPLRFAELERRTITELGQFAWIRNSSGDFTRFCDLSLEPNCLADLQSAYPIANFALAGRARAYAKERKSPRCIPAEPDATTQSALFLWGRR